MRTAARPGVDAATTPAAAGEPSGQSPARYGLFAPIFDQTRSWKKSCQRIPVTCWVAEHQRLGICSGVAEVGAGGFSGLRGTSIDNQAEFCDDSIGRSTERGDDMTPRTTNQSTAEQILGAACYALLESGFAAMSTRKVAERAGVPLSADPLPLRLEGTVDLDDVERAERCRWCSGNPRCSHWTCR